MATSPEVLDQIGECLNYLAFMDEKDSSFVAREFGGGEEIQTSVAMVQGILSDLYDEMEESNTITHEDEAAITAGMVPTHVVVCLSGLSVHVNGSPIFGCLVYGPFTEVEVGEKAKEIQRLEGGATLVRPLVNLAETYRRISAD